jgi:hypothetical protein
MAVPVWQSVQTNGVFAVSITINKPASTAAGDLLVACINMADNTKTLSPPAGWTAIRNDIGGAGDSAVNAYSWRRVADGSEGASFVFTVSSGSGVLLGAIGRITGAHQTTPINANNGQVNDTSVNGTAPSVTTTSSDCLLIYWAAGQVQSLATPPGGMSEQWDVNGSTFGLFSSFEGATEDRPTAGATGSRANTWTATCDNGAQLIAITPAPPAVVSMAGGNVGLSRTTTVATSFGCGSY